MDIKGCGKASPRHLIRSGSDAVADRLHVFYRFHVKNPGKVPRLVEQHLRCTLDTDRINGLDVVCTSFRPHTDACLDDEPAAV